MHYSNLEEWLTLSQNSNRIIITDATFCQFQIKNTISLKPITTNIPKVLTFKQFLRITSTTKINNKKYYINKFAAKYQLNQIEPFNSNQLDTFNKYYELNRYQALPNQLTWPEYTDNIINMQLINKYQQHLNKLQQYDEAMLFNELLKKTPHSKSWQHLLLATNQPLSKPELILLNHYCVTIHYLKNNKQIAKATHNTYQNAETEIHGVISQVIDNHKKNPINKIAIVTTSHQQAHFIYQQVRGALISHNLLELLNQTIYSAPQSLLSYPNITTAIWLLEQFTQPKTNLAEWLHYLTSHKIIISNDKNKNTDIIKHLLKNQQVALTWQNIYKLGNNHLKIFHQKLIACLKLIGTEKKHMHFWDKQFNLILNQWHWLGANNLNSNQLKIIEAWQHCWQQWAVLDEQKTFTAQEALALLKSYCKYNLFQHPHTTNQAKLTIINYNEVISGNYDTIWAIGFNSDQWPPTAKLKNMPKQICKLAQIPSAANNQQYINHYVTNLLYSAKQITSSHSAIVDQTTKHKSPYLTNNQFQAIETHLYATQIDSQLITFEDTSKFQPNKINATIIKDNNACSFKAIAIHHLKAYQVEKNSYSLSPRIKGEIIHDCLALIWQQLQNQANLIAQTNDALVMLVTKTAQAIIGELSKKYYWPLNKTFTKVETNIIIKQLLSWLELEKQRPDFTVAAIEQPIIFQYQKYKMKFRLDRVDSTSDGLIIIDYKTGQSSINDWFGSRPDNPQMLLYLLAYQPKAVGIIYGQIKTSKSSFAGITINPNWPKKSNINLPDETDWQSLEAEWQQIINTNIEQAIKIQPKINPKHPNTCRICHLQSLCRINEQKVQNAS